jgi:DNA-binding CsgD family transcriptional regulator
MRLGILASEQRRYERATALLAESLAGFKAVGYQWGITWALIYLGSVALMQGDSGRATALFEKSLRHFRELGDKTSMATSLKHLGQAALFQGKIEQAAAWSRESFALYRDAGVTLGIAECLEGMATIVWEQGAAGWAIRLLSSAAGLRDKLGAQLATAERSHYDRILMAARRRLGGERFQAAWNHGQSLSPEQAVAAHDQQAADPQSQAPRTVALRRADPSGLTVRELEVIRLVAAGLTDAEVAARLCVSRRTVHSHLRSIYGKLGVSSRTAATRLAIDRGLV